ncbi:urea ABC transporter substrate-binding protein [Desulfosarcina alkanivorans]|uniref:Urea ABC transporter substrate-binding protein n=1 Tax=Desulfosarcina alkanivorans TaxID=571177 RepID=A0A5K7YJH3_9BACT|nr:ABC transporter substrate-binding protein [Desulfosarcina alkanivorans]BBO68555.1 urea ABC transporter substrate-binding protein [Desulfosarcina alkanivorans]
MKRVTILSMVMAFLVLSGSTAMAADNIPVGVPLAMTGAYTGSGDDYFKGIKMAIDEINEAGGLLGKPVEIIRYDSKEFAPEVVMQGADYLCGQKKVTSVHAGWAGWGQDVRAYGKYDVPFFADDGSQAAVDVYRENPAQYSNIFQLTDVGIEQAKSMFRVLMALPYEYPNKKAVIINTDDSWGVEVGDTLESSFKKKGWKVAKRETVPYGTNEWGAILTRIRRIKPALIHIEIPSAQENITFFRQFIKKPTSSILSLGWGITPREVVENLGDAADGIVGEMPTGLPGPVAPNAAGQAWIDKFVKLYNHQIPAGSWATYTGVMAWAKAVTAVGDAYDFKAVNAYLRENGYNGHQGLIRWDKDNVLRAQEAAPVVHYQVQGGELKAIYTDPPTRAYKDSKFIVPRWIK